MGQSQERDLRIAGGGTAHDGMDRACLLEDRARDVC